MSGLLCRLLPHAVLTWSDPDYGFCIFDAAGGGLGGGKLVAMNDRKVSCYGQKQIRNT
jgi:hypothetical protein